ncbi:attractin-like protein, partial [Dinothrombium tinctorium]
MLNPSQFPRYLHSAVIINGLMYVFGGNGHNATHDSTGDKSFSPQFMAYDIECDRWFFLKDTLFSFKSNVNIGRYGHTAAVYDNNMYVFGGFNGFMLNSVLKYNPGDCSYYRNSSNYFETKPGLSCVWNEQKKVCQSLTSFKPSSLPPFSFNSSAFKHIPQRTK